MSLEDQKTQLKSQLEALNNNTKKQQEALRRTLSFYEKMPEAPKFDVAAQPFLLTVEWFSATGQRTTGLVHGRQDRSAQATVWTCFTNRAVQILQTQDWGQVCEEFFFGGDKKNQGMRMWTVEKQKEMATFGALDGTKVQFPEDLPKNPRGTVKQRRNAYGEFTNSY